jgi:hypothetical protein
VVGLVQRNELFIANHNGMLGVVFPSVSFQHKQLPFAVAQVATCSPVLRHYVRAPSHLKVVTALIMLALDSEGRLWVWGWADLELQDNLAAFGMGRNPRQGLRVDDDGSITVVHPMELILPLEVLPFSSMSVPFHVPALLLT